MTQYRWMSGKQKRTSALSLIEWETDRDLRYVSQRSDFLDKVTREYDLHDGQGVLYSNCLLTKFRIVAVIAGMPILIIPPVASSGELLLSIFLRVSIFVRGLNPSRGLIDSLDEHITVTEVRVARSTRIRSKKRRRHLKAIA